MENKRAFEAKGIVAALGGPVTLSAKLELPYQTVYAWTQRGIPPKYQLMYPRLINKGRRLAALADKVSGK